MSAQQRTWMKAFIMLVLCLLSSSMVFATPQILSVSGRGTDNIEGIVRSVDAITFEARITNDGNAVDPARVRLGQSIFFTSCSPLYGGEYLCSVRDPLTGTASIGFDQAIPFDIYLLTVNNTVAAVRSGRVLVDSRIPAVGFSGVVPPIAARENINFNFDVSDEACAGTLCQNNCSGIKKLEFFYFLSGAKQIVQTQNPATRACTLSSTVTLPSSTFPEGPNALYIQATDMIGQLSEVNSIPFTIDNNGPNLVDSSFSLKYRGKELFHYRSSAPIPIVATFQLNDADLDVQSVYADLSQLNPSNSALSHAVPSCTQVSSSVWNCTWSITMLLGSSGPKQITINASDAEGNPSVTQVVRSFTLDDTGPTLSSITAGNANYAFPLSTFTAQVVESGVGIFAPDMKLRVGSQIIPATSCLGSTCTWSNVALSVGNANVSLDQSSIDILGNGAQAFSQGFVVTTAPPQVVNAKIVGIGGLTGIVASYIATGDRIQIVANVTEDTSIASATADLSQFIPGQDAVSGGCDYVSGNTFLCTWMSDPIERARSGQVVLTLRDGSGNSMNHSIALRTYSTDNNATPNYWMSTLSCTPSVLDRMIGPLINQKSYCTVKLAPRTAGSQLQTVSMELSGCTSNALIQNTQIFNIQPGSVSPLLKLTMAKSDMKVDEIKTTCTINIYSKVGDTLTRAPEEEQVFVTLQFFNNPLGTVDDAAQKKLDDALKSTEGLQGFIGTLNNILHYAQNFCRLLSAYTNIAQGMYAIAQIVSAKGGAVCDAGKVLPFVGVACPPMATAARTSCMAQQGQEDLVAAGWLDGGNKLCKIASCQWTPEIISGLGDTVTEQFNKLPYLEGQFKTTEIGWEAGMNAKGRDYSFDQKDTKIMDDAAKNARPFGVAMKDLSGYPINVKSSLVTSTLFGCVPGIIENLDKYRQINCLYADCIQTAVMEDNVPLKVCEDLKAEATCKYVMGEVFAIVPYTAIFDSAVNFIKGELSNPLSAIGLGMTAGCKFACATQGSTGPAVFTYSTCNTFRLVSKIGLMTKEVMGIVQAGFWPPKTADYCQIVKDRNAGNSTSTGLFGGLFGGSSKS